MEITYLQLLGAVLIYCGVYGFIKGKIEWEAEVGPGSRSDATFSIDLTPDKYKKKYSGVLEGKWVKPCCIFLAVIGAALVFIVTGESVAFKI